MSNAIFTIIFYLAGLCVILLLAEFISIWIENMDKPKKRKNVKIK